MLAETSLRWDIGVGSSNGKVGTGVYLCHSAAFPLPVLAAVLYDAETVDPQILVSQPIGEGDSILECLREFLRRDSSLVFGQGDRRRLSNCTLPPAVTETNIRLDFAAGLVQLDVLWVLDQNDASWQARFSTLTQLMFVIAFS